MPDIIEALTAAIDPIQLASNENWFSRNPDTDLTATPIISGITKWTEIPFRNSKNALGIILISVIIAAGKIEIKSAIEKSASPKGKLPFLPKNVYT
jgi:hypothetical protein